MPTLAEATKPIDRSGLSPLPHPIAAPVAVYAGQQFPPNPNPFLRCPTPPNFATPDNLRQYYFGGQIPQSRILTPATIAQASGGGTTIVNSTTSSSSTSATTKTLLGTVQSASITTPVLNPGDVYQTTFGTSSTFVPILFAVSAVSRVELYATAAAQSADMARSNAVSPGPATQQGIFLDVSLDTSPLTWLITPALPCVNGDSPQLPQSYITVTNTGVASNAITATLQYLILEL